MDTSNISKDNIYLQDYSGLLIQRSCNEIFPTYPHCDLVTNTVIHEQFVKKVYYFIVNFVMFFIPVILMSICYSMIIAKLYCSTSPGERIGGLMFVVVLDIGQQVTIFLYQASHLRPEQREKL